MELENTYSFQKYRGGVALCGRGISAIAHKWAARFSHTDGFSFSQKCRLERDGEEYHMTVVSPSEKKTGLDVSIDKLNDESLNGLELFDLGVGSRDGCFYVVIIAPKLQKIRKQLGLAHFDFHITLGFAGSDAHGARRDVSSLLPCPGHEVEFWETAERMLRAPSGAAGRQYFHYLSVAARAMQEGYLFGAYYAVKFNATLVSDPRAAHDIFEQRIYEPCTCKRLDNETTDYGDLVCQALNGNIYTKSSYYRLRRFYQSKVSTETSPSHYAISETELPRNFGFVTENLAGSSILEYRRYFECLVPIGITDVITVMEDPMRPALYAGLPLRYHFFHVEDRTPPTTAQMKDIVKICESVDGKVLVHCQGGVGRTATVLAAMLMWTQGLSRAEAKQPLLEHRKTIIDDRQDVFLSEWYQECQQRPAAAPVGHRPTAARPTEKLPPILMCVGFPSSGKSSFSEALCAAFPGHVTRVNQDERGRRECEQMMGELTKRSGHTVILDRCNLTRAERKEWLSLGHNRRAWVLSFTASLEECKWRIVRRTGHPTIKHGSGRRIIEAVADTLEVPDKSEGFEKVITVPTFDACNMLLQSWGCEVMPESTLPEEEGMLKFPRTRHVQNLGAATRDDLVMTQQEVEMTFLRHKLFVEEKIDGANMGLSIRNNQLVAQNRSHFVCSAYHAQFKLLDKWIAKHADDLWRILDSDRYILYGEWVYAKHSIHYKNLPDWFIAFDMYDKLEGKFWSRPRLEQHLEGTSIHLIPLVACGSFDTAEQLRALAQTPSQFYDGPVEGVYLRRCNDDMWLTERGKIVRADFMSGNEFWSKGGVQPNEKPFFSDPVDS